VWFGITIFRSLNLAASSSGSCGQIDSSNLISSNITKNADSLSVSIRPIRVTDFIHVPNERDRDVVNGVSESDEKLPERLSGQLCSLGFHRSTNVSSDPVIALEARRISNG
jgi:hypothetical protein